MRIRSEKRSLRRLRGGVSGAVKLLIFHMRFFVRSLKKQLTLLPDCGIMSITDGHSAFSGLPDEF